MLHAVTCHSPIWYLLAGLSGSCNEVGFLKNVLVFSSRLCSEGLGCPISIRPKALLRVVLRHETHAASTTRPAFFFLQSYTPIG